MRHLSPTVFGLAPELALHSPEQRRHSSFPLSPNTLLPSSLAHRARVGPPPSPFPSPSPSTRESSRHCHSARQKPSSSSSSSSPPPTHSITPPFSAILSSSSARSSLTLVSFHPCAFPPLPPPGSTLPHSSHFPSTNEHLPPIVMGQQKAGFFWICWCLSSSSFSRAHLATASSSFCCSISASSSSSVKQTLAVAVVVVAV